MNVYEIPGGGLISVCFLSLSYHLNVTSSPSVACHSLISIQCLARWSHYLRWMYQTRGLLLWGSFSSDSNAGPGEPVTGFSVEKYTLECQKDILQANICLSVCFPLALSTQFLIWRVHGPPSSSRPCQRTQGFLCISAIRSQAPQRPGPIVLLPVVVAQALCMVK